jgi:hypothetical protein
VVPVFLAILEDIAGLFGAGTKPGAEPIEAS